MMGDFGARITRHERRKAEHQGSRRLAASVVAPVHGIDEQATRRRQKLRAESATRRKR
jgi:hypothetical protein